MNLHSTLANVLLFVSLAAVLGAVAGAFVATRAAAISSKSLSALSRTTKELSTLKLSLDAAREDIDSLGERFELMRAREGMREVRAAKKNKERSLEDLPPGEWKEAARKAYGVGPYAGSKRGE